ncbi:MAG: aminotransferase class V-fold PLP-dependent enzyme [Chloroflexota bacterium]
MDIYDRLGVRKAISCCGTFTILGGALMDPRVLDAMKEASRTHVLIEELQVKAGRYVADLIGVEAAFITTGAAGGLFLATAALIAGTDRVTMARLPDTQGLKNEVIVCKSQRFDFDRAIRTLGGRFVEIGNSQGTQAWEMEAAITDRTAFAFWVAELNEDTALPFATFRDIAHASGVAVLVDNAAEIPPAANLRKFTDLGADLVVISGGKGLRGPQSTGLILGRRDLIEACRVNSSPDETVIGRPLKVGKEEICGLVAALELYINETSKRERDVWEGIVGYLVEQLQGLPWASARRQYPYRPTREIPVVVVELAPRAPLKVTDVLERLKAKDPPIYAYAPKRGFGYAPGQGFILNPHTMLEGEAQIVAQRLLEILNPAAERA